MRIHAKWLCSVERRFANAAVTRSYFKKTKQNNKMLGEFVDVLVRSYCRIVNTEMSRSTAEFFFLLFV
jgi:hypothetical protein